MALILKSNNAFTGDVNDLPKVQPLDLYGTSFAAFGLRKLNSLYTGNAIEVRRSSDDTVLEIGFEYNHLDQNSLLSFVGSGDGYVTKWFDQSGNGRNLIQTTALNQPKIVSSGSMTLINNIPSIDFDGTNCYLDGSSLVSAFRNSERSHVSAISLNRNTIGVNNLISFSVAASTSARLSIDCNADGFSNKYRTVGRRISTDASALAVSSINHEQVGHVVTSDANWFDGSLSLRLDSNIVGTSSLASSGLQADSDSDSVYIGQSNTESARWDGLMSELYIYENSLGQSLINLEKDMLSFLNS